jgi:hypothetical protein
VNDAPLLPWLLTAGVVGGVVVMSRRDQQAKQAPGATSVFPGGGGHGQGVPGVPFPLPLPSSFSSSDAPSKAAAPKDPDVAVAHALLDPRNHPDPAQLEEIAKRLPDQLSDLSDQLKARAQGIRNAQAVAKIRQQFPARSLGDVQAGALVLANPGVRAPRELYAAYSQSLKNAGDPTSLDLAAKLDAQALKVPPSS